MIVASDSVPRYRLWSESRRAAPADERWVVVTPATALEGVTFARTSEARWTEWTDTTEAV